MPKISGQGAAFRRLERMTSNRKVQLLGQALFVAGDEIKAEASKLITRNSAGGHSGGKHQHIVSRPGEPPHEDTGHLRSLIVVNQPHPLRVLITSNARYAAALEFGTSKMAARPYMGPAARMKKKRVKDLVNKAIDAATAKKG